MDCFGWLVEQKMGRKVRKRKLLPYFCDKDRFLFVELLETMTARSTGLMVRFDFVMKMERVAFCLYFFHNDSFQSIDLFDFCLLFVLKEKFSR